MSSSMFMWKLLKLSDHLPIADPPSQWDPHPSIEASVCIRMETGGGRRGIETSQTFLQVHGVRSFLRDGGVSCGRSRSFERARGLKNRLIVFSLFFRTGSTIEANCRDPMSCSSFLLVVWEQLMKEFMLIRIDFRLSVGRDRRQERVDHRRPSHVKHLAGVKRDFFMFIRKPFSFRNARACWQCIRHSSFDDETRSRSSRYAIMKMPWLRSSWTAMFITFVKIRGAVHSPKGIATNLKVSFPSRNPRNWLKWGATGMCQ